MLERDGFARQNVDGAGVTYEGEPPDTPSHSSRGRLRSSGEMRAARQSDDGNAYVFPGPKPGTTLSNMALLMLLRRMNSTI